MILIGKVNTLIIKSIQEKRVELIKEEVAESVFLDSYSNLDPTFSEGDKIDVFIYTGSKGELVATTEFPFAKLDEYACMLVKRQTQFGAFLDWGINKDLLVPFSEQYSPMDEDEHYVIRVCLDDKTNRFYGTNKFKKYLHAADPTLELEVGQEVDVLPYEGTEIGLKSVVNNKFAGMIYFNEMYDKITIGDNLKGYVKKLRNDNLVDISLVAVGVKNAILSSTEKILQKLELGGGFLPYHDKSSPEDIKRVFQMSKQLFKKTIGTLYKEKKILISKEGIRENKKSDE